MKLQKQIHRFVVKDLRRCRWLHEKLVSVLGKLPEGSISVRDGELCRFVRIKGKAYTVPLRGDMKLLNSLKARRIIKKCIPVLKARIKLCEDFLENEVIYDPEQIVKKLPEQYHGLCGIPVFPEGDVNADDWKIRNYQRNPMEFKGNHFTAEGIRCRSKSEAMIGTRLEAKGILYRAEPELDLKDRTVYPDFEMLLEETREIKYWEHFGMIDDPVYAQKCIIKLKDYSESGYRLGDNLFITYETLERPLTMPEIDRTIDRITGIT